MASWRGQGKTLPLPLFCHVHQLLKVCITTNRNTCPLPKNLCVFTRTIISEARRWLFAHSISDSSGTASWFYRVMEMHRLSTHTSTAAVQKMLAKYFCNFRTLWLLLNRNHVLKIWAKDMNTIFFLTALPSKTFMCPMVHIIQQLPSFSLPQYIYFFQWRNSPVCA